MGNHMLLPIIVSLVTIGCASPGNYFDDRLNDLTDMAHVELVGLAFGFNINVGPAVLGVFHISGTQAISGRHGHGKRIRYGFGGTQEIISSDICWGLIVPLGFHREDARSRVGYGKTAPGWGSVGLNIGYWLGFGARIDVIEMLDFVIGFSTLDILADDAVGEEEEEEKDEEEYQTTYSMKCTLLQGVRVPHRKNSS